MKVKARPESFSTVRSEEKDGGPFDYQQTKRVNSLNPAREPSSSAANIITGIQGAVLYTNYRIIWTR